MVDTNMKVGDFMTECPACCTPEMPLKEAARLMVENDCGEIPVVENQQTLRPIGVITDRDIACRAVALGKNALTTTVAECMSNPIVTVSRDATLEECCQLFEESLVRRLPVTDVSGRCCGIVSQADIAQYAPEEQTAELLREISRPTDWPSRVAEE